MGYKMKGFTYPGKSPVKQGKPVPLPSPGGKGTKDPGMKIESKGNKAIKLPSPNKQKPKKSTESAHGQLSDAEREYQDDLKTAKRKKLDHIGKPYMRPPYKDTASGIRPYEKRQGYHGFKDFDSIIPQFQNKNKK